MQEKLKFRAKASNIKNLLLKHNAYNTHILKRRACLRQLTSIFVTQISLMAPHSCKIGTRKALANFWTSKLIVANRDFSSLKRTQTSVHNTKLFKKFREKKKQQIKSFKDTKFGVSLSAFCMRRGYE